MQLSTKLKPQTSEYIHTIRNKHIMLDRDLAVLYEIPAIRLREQMKRNRDRFPDDFMFQLTNTEVELMVSQNAIPSKSHLGGHNPYAFTQEGVAMLSSVLTSPKAIQVNISIMRTFVRFRKTESSLSLLNSRVKSLEDKQDENEDNFNQIFQYLEVPLCGIFYEGQTYDGYKTIIDIIKTARKSIILIDNYIDDSVVNMLKNKNKNVTVTIYTKKTTKLEVSIKKANDQYPKIKIKDFRKSHDRFLIIDEEYIYHIGASLKDLGKKWFAISRFTQKDLNILSKLP